MRETHKTVAHAVLIHVTREIIQILELLTQPLVRQLATALLSIAGKSFHYAEPV